ncbi:hypothetical protein E4U17_007885 [Claviceps sp. LM77 group G4]|nr:hypothetical protein E4U17_007885 [Claviceps sp. LM77 group G4]KAG6074996.1 hypothetical protein E4U16_003641 [Claviceps sp. LM84 group G4]KAG6085964.1 hypothetical protein E4U33_000477 [Claviceps sp. LM78 group G4]
MPSPTPKPEPESQSPPPGPRAQRLHQIHAASLARTLDKLAYENLAPCFPTIARRAEPILRQVQSQMVQKLREKSEAEFEAILRARGVVGKLNELEGVVAAAAEEQARVRAEDKRTGEGEGEGEDDRIPPHLLPPQDILAAHLSPRLAVHQSLLNARLQTTQAQNALLADHVRQQRQEMEELLGQLDRAVEDVRGANAVLGAVADELAAEARAVDGQLRTEMAS